MQFFKRIFFFLLTNMAVLALLSIVMMVVNYFFPGILSANGGMLQLLIYALVLGFGGAIISLLISRWSAKRAYSIVLLDSQTAGRDPQFQIVWSTVERIAQANQITMPEVGYYESAEPNAFATGATKNKSLVAVSTGLLAQMERNEVEGVV
jgi:heat shock protein HtpX